MNFDDTAVLFESGWTLIDWVLPIVALLAAITVLCFARELTVWILELIDNQIVAALVSALVLLISAIATVSLTLTLMRHSPDQAFAWIIAAILGVLAIALGIRGYIAPNAVLRYTDWVAAGTIAWAAVSGVTIDALNRGASAIPTSASSYATALIVFAGIVVYFVVRRR